jgi:hypothetical protein
MDESGKSFASEPVNVRQWSGRIIVAVVLGEAIWNLIVSVMNNLFVPWLGALMGPGSGLPTSFIQRPYDYPDLFVSVFEFCIAGLVAAILNYFLQRPKAVRTRAVKNPVRAAQPAPAPVIPRPAPIAAAAMTQAPTPAPAVVRPAPVVPPTPVVAPAPIVRPEPIAPPAPVIPAPPAPPVANPVVAAKPVPRPAPPPKPAPPVAKAEPPKPKKPKEVYYNIVGEPMPSDDD